MTRKLPLPPQLAGINPQFLKMLALSLLLHALASTPWFFPKAGSFSGPTVTFMDLNMVQDSRPATAMTAKPPADMPETAQAEAAPQQPPPAAAPSTELEKLQRNMQKTLADAAAQRSTVQEVSLGLGMTSGYFSSLAEGQTLRGNIREYYFEVLRSINEQWWLNKESSLKGGNRALINLVIARDGTVVGKQMVRSSGNPAYDRAILRTLEATNPLPPLPESFPGDFFQAPIRFNAPLNLMETLKIG
jgi:periplasmic protein TonB